MSRWIRGAFTTLMVIGFAVQINAQAVNKSNLWFGGDEGIEVVWKTGKNLAYTEENPKIDPRMTKHARGFDQALLKIGERSYLAFGWGLTSPMMVVGDDGIIIIDPTESVEAGKECLAAFRRVTDKPVRAIVYTHNHFDHVAGVKAFTTEEDVATGKVDIYAHETMLQGVINWASTVGPIEGRRTSYTGAVLLPKGPDGSVHDALGPDARVGTITFIPPTKTFSDELDVTVAGVKMHLLYLPSETEDEIIAWFPDDKLLNSAEVMQGENFPNLYTIRGTKYRDPVKWFKSIDVMREFPAEYLVPTYGRPIVGHDNIQNMLTAYRDQIQFVHDQTIRYMNRGYTPEQLVEVVKLPPHLAEHPWTNEYYGTVKHAVRNIYGGYLGWFQGDPWALDPMPYMERAKRYVELMGGRDAVLKAAQKAVDGGEYTWAAEILTNVIRVDNSDMEARRLKAEAYRQFAYTLVNVNWRNWALTAAAELDGEADLSGGVALTSSDVIRAFTTDKLLEGGTKKDVQKFFSYFDEPVDVGSINLIVR